MFLARRMGRRTKNHKGFLMQILKNIINIKLPNNNSNLVFINLFQAQVLPELSLTTWHKKNENKEQEGEKESKR